MAPDHIGPMFRIILVETAELLISLDEWVVKNNEIKTWRGWFFKNVG